MHVARNDFSPVNVARTSKKVGSFALNENQIFRYLIIRLIFAVRLKPNQFLKF